MKLSASDNKALTQPGLIFPSRHRLAKGMSGHEMDLAVTDTYVQKMVGCDRMNARDRCQFRALRGNTPSLVSSRSNLSKWVLAKRVSSAALFVAVVSRVVQHEHVARMPPTAKVAFRVPRQYRRVMSQM